MAKTANLYRGGKPIVLIPNCNADFDFSRPFPHTMGNVYAQSHYALSLPFNPSLMAWQRTAVRNVAVDDTVLLLAVPSRSILDDVYLEFAKLPELATGLTFELSILRATDSTFDEDGFEELASFALADIGPKRAITDPVEDRVYGVIDNTALLAKLPNKAEDAVTIPGETLFIGMKILTLPDNGSLDKYDGIINFGVHARANYSITQL